MAHPRDDPVAGQDPGGRRLERDHQTTMPADLPGCGWRSGHHARSSRWVTRSARPSTTVHIDGYNLLPYLTGKEDSSPRKGLIYFSDDGDVLAIRYDNWKVVFSEQRVPGTLQIWAEPFTPLRVPKLFNLRTDPYERADITSNTYYDWIFDNDYLILAGSTMVGQFLQTFIEFPPRQKAASFTIDQVMEKLEAALTAGH